MDSGHRFIPEASKAELNGNSSNTIYSEDGSTTAEDSFGGNGFGGTECVHVLNILLHMHGKNNLMDHVR